MRRRHEILFPKCNVKLVEELTPSSSSHILNSVFKCVSRVIEMGILCHEFKRSLNTDNVWIQWA